MLGDHNISSLFSSLHSVSLQPGSKKKQESQLEAVFDRMNEEEEEIAKNLTHSSFSDE